MEDDVIDADFPLGSNDKEFLQEQPDNEGKFSFAYCRSDSFLARTWTKSCFSMKQNSDASLSWKNYGGWISKLYFVFGWLLSMYAKYNLLPQ